ncbi:MAG: hypothetical protein AAF658_13710 [Myxococcota bacterium]
MKSPSASAPLLFAGLSLVVLACRTTAPSPDSPHLPPEKVQEPVKLDEVNPDPPSVIGAAECQSDADCVLFCPESDVCCSSPCGCKNAIARARLAEQEASFERDCAKPPRCPAMGCRREDATGARCEAGRCRPSFGLR